MEQIWQRPFCWAWSACRVKCPCGTRTFPSRLSTWAWAESGSWPLVRGSHRDPGEGHQSSPSVSDSCSSKLHHSGNDGGGEVMAGEEYLIIIIIRCMEYKLRTMSCALALIATIVMQCNSYSTNYDCTTSCALACLACLVYYRIAGKFGGELNLAVWRSSLRPPKLKSANISYLYIYVWRSLTEPPNLNPPMLLKMAI